jgi:hypothetical protein
VFGRRWYREVLIIAVILPIASIVIALFIPIPFSWLFILILFVLLIISRIGKRALTVKEAVVLVLVVYGGYQVGGFIFYRLNQEIGYLLPDQLHVVISIPIIFMIIWLIHRNTTTTEQKEN